MIDRRTALFLDYDGTLADLAPTPEEARPLAGVVSLLGQVSDWLGGALAILSGRSIADIDGMLAPLHLTVAGVHGAEVRRNGGDILRHRPPPGIERARKAAQTLVSEHPALRLEDKDLALAVHYRAAPDLGDVARNVLVRAVDGDPELDLIHGKMVHEVRTARIHKGAALLRLMELPPFQGRCPVMVGDDRTDEDAFHAVNDLGGISIKVGAGDTAASHRLADVAAVHRLLRDTLAHRTEGNSA